MSGPCVDPHRGPMACRCCVKEANVVVVAEAAAAVLDQEAIPSRAFLLPALL